MLELKSRQLDQPKYQPIQQSPIPAKIEEELEALHRSDRSLHNLMGMEVWAIAKTMDEVYPGFWNQFMENRRLAFKQFMEQKQAHRSLEYTAARLPIKIIEVSFS